MASGASGADSRRTSRTTTSYGADGSRWGKTLLLIKRKLGEICHFTFFFPRKKAKLCLLYFISSKKRLSSFLKATTNKPKLLLFLSSWVLRILPAPSPHGPFRGGGGTHEASLRPGGGVGGVWAPNFWWGGTGISTRTSCLRVRSVTITLLGPPPKLLLCFI